VGALNLLRFRGSSASGIGCRVAITVGAVLSTVGITLEGAIGAGAGVACTVGITVGVASTVGITAGVARTVVGTEVMAAISIASTEMTGEACTVRTMVAVSCIVGTGSGEDCIAGTGGDGGGTEGDGGRIAVGVGEPGASFSCVVSRLCWCCCPTGCGIIGGTGVSLSLEGPSIAMVDVGASTEEWWLAPKSRIGVGAGVRDVRLVNEGLGLGGVGMRTSGLAVPSCTEVGASVDSAGRIPAAGVDASDGPDEGVGVGVGVGPPGLRRWVILGANFFVFLSGWKMSVYVGFE